MDHKGGVKAKVPNTAHGPQPEAQSAMCMQKEKVRCDQSNEGCVMESKGP